MAAPAEPQATEPSVTALETVVDEDTVFEVVEPSEEYVAPPAVIDLATLQEVDLQFEDEVVEIAPHPNLSPQPTSLSELLNVYATFTDTGESILLTGEDAEINLADLAGRDMTIVAESKDPGVSIGSVELSLGSEFSRVENIEPYALFGDKNGDLYDGAEVAPGDYTLALTVYSKKGGKGDVLEQNEFSLSVLSDSGIDELTGFAYVDAAPDAVMMVEDADQTGWDELLF